MRFPACMAAAPSPPPYRGDYKTLAAVTRTPTPIPVAAGLSLSRSTLVQRMPETPGNFWCIVDASGMNRKRIIKKERRKGKDDNGEMRTRGSFAISWNYLYSFVYICRQTNSRLCCNKAFVMRSVKRYGDRARNSIGLRGLKGKKEKKKSTLCLLHNGERLRNVCLILNLHFPSLKLRIRAWNQYPSLVSLLFA